MPEVEPNTRSGPHLSLRDWFSSGAGAAIATQEAAVAAELLPDLFGYHLVQLGRPHGEPLLGSSRIGHQVILDPASGDPGLGLRGRADALPLQTGAVDVVVLPHGLEFATDPYGVLREVERVLIPEGYLLLYGFNPLSVFGAWRLALGWRGEYPWCGRFIPLARLQEWLAVLGFEVERTAGLSFRPPLQHSPSFHRLEWLERLGRHFLPFLGNVYWLLACKRVPAIRPIRAVRARRRRLQTAAIAEPSRWCEGSQERNDA